jgi:hypothetical protein
MKKIFFLLMTLGFTSQLQAQELVQKKYIVYETSMRDVAGQYHRGYIATLGDTTLFMSKKKFALTFENTDLKCFQKFGYTDIVRVDLRSSAGVKKGVLIGGITGMLAGAIVGYSSVKNTGPKQFGSVGIGSPNVTQLQGGLIGAAIGAGLGSLVGVICGHSHLKFKIHGRKDKFFDMRETMIRTLY